MTPYTTTIQAKAKGLNKRNNYGRGYHLVFSDGYDVIVLGIHRGDIKAKELDHGKLVSRTPL